MDRLRALSSHLPSVISEKLPGNIYFYRRPSDDGSHIPLTHFPPAEWSQAGNNGTGPAFPLPQQAYPQTLDERRGSATSTNAPSPFVLGPATPVARPTRWTPRTLRLSLVIPIIILMILLAVGVEVAYFESHRQNGFPVSGISKAIDPQFFVSFVPVALVVPLAIFWRLTDHEIQRIQPYITASHGNAPAERSVLLDYPNTARTTLFAHSLRFGHRLVFVSGLIAVITAVFQPITAAIFVVRSTLYVMPEQSVTSMSTLGLRPDFNDLTAFAAASGYVDAAIAHNLGDPPFVVGGWSVAGFDYNSIYSDVAKNGTISVTTVATHTDTRCSPVDSIVRQGSAASWTGTFEGCSASFTIEVSDTTETNFGVVKVDNCNVNGATPDDPFKPVMFWFYGSSAQTSMTFCSPTVAAFNVDANLTLFNNSLAGVTTLNEYQMATNVTSGPPLQGLALNGIFFDASIDKFVTARNTALQSAIPGTIFRAAQNKAADASAIFANSTFLANLTTSIYTQYLATAGQSNFFLSQASLSPAVIQAWQPRIWMNTLATHAFAAVFLAIAIASLALHIRHTHERRWLFLAGPVGSIASAVSLTSSARFAGLLNAGDTEGALEEKLRGMYFGIDKDTWQIVVERDNQDHLNNLIYSDEGKSDLKWGKGKKNNRASVVSVSSVASAGRVSVVGTMQHPTTLASDDVSRGRRPSTTSTPLTGTFSVQPSPSPYNARMSELYTPPAGPPPSAHSSSFQTYPDPYSRHV